MRGLYRGDWDWPDDDGLDVQDEPLDAEEREVRAEDGELACRSRDGKVLTPRSDAAPEPEVEDRGEP